MYFPANPAFTSALKGAVAYGQAENERLEKERLEKEKRNKRMYIMLAGVAAVVIIYFYKTKK